MKNILIKYELNAKHKESLELQYFEALQACKLGKSEFKLICTKQFSDFVKWADDRACKSIESVDGVKKIVRVSNLRLAEESFEDFKLIYRVCDGETAEEIFKDPVLLAYHNKDGIFFNVVEIY
jgi:hypothetical protein